MSYRALNWAWEMEIPGTRKFVLVALADMADENESCYPGQERLSRMVGASVRSVRDAIVWLEDAGLLKRERRFRDDGTRNSDRYVLQTQMDYRQILPVEPPANPARLPADSVGDHRQDLPGNHQKNPQKNPQSPPPLFAAPNDGPKLDLIHEAFERLWAMWPARRRGTTKKSGASFRTAVRSVGGVRSIDTIMSAAARHTAVWRTWPAADQQYVPGMTTWLNQERWTEPDPEPRGDQAAPRGFDPEEHYAWLRTHRITEEQWQSLATEHGARDARAIVEGRAA